MTIWVDINLGRDHRNLIMEGICCSTICPDFHLCRITENSLVHWRWKCQMSITPFRAFSESTPQKGP